MDDDVDDDDDDDDDGDDDDDKVNDQNGEFEPILNGISHVFTELKGSLLRSSFFLNDVEIVDNSSAEHGVDNSSRDGVPHRITKIRRMRGIGKDGSRDCGSGNVCLFGNCRSDLVR